MRGEGQFHSVLEFPSDVGYLRIHFGIERVTPTLQEQQYSSSNNNRRETCDTMQARFNFHGMPSYSVRMNFITEMCADLPLKLNKFYAHKREKY